MTNANLTVKKKAVYVKGAQIWGFCVCLIWNLLHVIVLTFRILRCPLDFLRLVDTWYRPAA